MGVAAVISDGAAEEAYSAARTWALANEEPVPDARMIDAALLAFLRTRITAPVGVQEHRIDPPVSFQAGDRVVARVSRDGTVTIQVRPS